MPTIRYSDCANPFAQSNMGRCVFRRKSRQEVRYPLRTAFRGAVRLNDARRARQILDSEDPTTSYLIGWNYDRCLAYAVYKRAFDVAKVLLQRGADPTELTAGNHEGAHYHRQVLNRVVYKNDTELFEWLLANVKPSSFSEDVVDEAYELARDRGMQQIAKMIVEHFEVDEELIAACDRDVPVETTVPRVDSESETDIDSTESDSD